MKTSSVEKVMSATKDLCARIARPMAYGPEIVKKAGLSSTTVYSALRELVATGMLNHYCHGGPYYLTEKSR